MADRSEKSRLFKKSAKEWQEYDPIGEFCRWTCLVSCCNNTVTYAPLIFICFLVVWSYFAYVICFCFLVLPSEEIGLIVVLLLLFHILLAMFVWTYVVCVSAEAEPIAEQYRLKESEVAELSESEADIRGILERIVQERALQCQTRTADGVVRHCRMCRTIKPDRTHHCSVCKRCVVKMDHHCPWIANCVGHHNYKQFVQLLVYTSLLCLLQFASILPNFLQFVATAPAFSATFARYNVIVLLFVAAVFFLAVFSLLLYHVYLILHNQSTLEASRAPVYVASSATNRNRSGALANMRQVCGDRLCSWLVPLQPALVNDDAVGTSTGNTLDSACVAEQLKTTEADSSSETNNNASTVSLREKAHYGTLDTSTGVLSN